MNLAAVASDLFSLTPDEFTAARNAHAADAKGGGDKVLAEQIRRLPKPSSSAWVVNMLVRHRAEQIDGVVELGASLRTAQENLDAKQLRSLSVQRSRLIAAVAQQGRELAQQFGHAASDGAVREVEQTLQAAMADAWAASAVKSGCLLRALSSDGVEPADLAGAVAIPLDVSARPSPADGMPQVRDIRSRSKRGEPDAKAKEARARALMEAQRALDQAERGLEDAASALDDVRNRIAKLAPEREKLLRELDGLEERIGELGTGITAIDRETRVLERDRRNAERAADDARSEVNEARDRLGGLR